MSICLLYRISLVIFSLTFPLFFPLSTLLAGSRVSRELRYTKEKQGEEAVFTSQMLIQTPKQEGTNILTQESLLLHLEAAVSASKVQVSLYGK